VDTTQAGGVPAATAVLAAGDEVPMLARSVVLLRVLRS
jgi:hypothetical protein